MKGVMCEWILGCLLGAPAPVPPDAVPTADPAELQYRAILYELYQGHDEDALVEALATEAVVTKALDTRQRGASAGEDVHRVRLAELDSAFAIGASGIGRDAAARLSATSLTPADALRAALLVARDAYRRQDWPTLALELGKADTARALLDDTERLPEHISAELALENAELATAQGDYVHAADLIETIPERDSGRAFALFNLGVALRNSGLPTRSEEVFAKLAALRVYDPAALDVKQRALVALMLLNQQHTASATAESYLRRIPAGSRYHDAALVTYAKLAMDHGDYQLGARIWSALLAESIWSNAGKAAQVGYPVCLENIGKTRVALTQYRAAEVNFTERAAALNALTEQLEDVAWSRRLLRAMMRLPDAPLSDPTLAQWRGGLGSDDWVAWLTDPSVQQLLSQLHELDDILAWLDSGDATAATALAERRRDLKARVAALVADHEQRLRASLAAIVTDESAIADRQLRLIRVGIARTTDRIAEQAPQ